MDEKDIKKYLELIKIKSINGYGRNVLTYVFLLGVTSIIYLGIPSDIIANYTACLEILSIGLPSTITTLSLLIKKKKLLKKYKTNNPCINTSIKLNDIYNILENENVIKKTNLNKIDKYFIDPELYYTQEYLNKVKKRVLKR